MKTLQEGRALICVHSRLEQLLLSEFAATRKHLSSRTSMSTIKVTITIRSGIQKGEKKRNEFPFSPFREVETY
jgi:hypothetical protein